MIFKKQICAVVLTWVSSHAYASDCVHLVFGEPSKSDFVNCLDGYAIGYDYEHKGAEWVSYMLIKETWDPVKRQDDFRPDINIPKEHRTYNEDYLEPIYDRGHLANSASIDFSIEANSDTFLMSNIVPQLPAHNRGVWKTIENYERKLAEKKGHLYVVSGVMYDDNKSDRKTIGNGISIPTHFWKVIFIPQTKETISFFTEHKRLPSGTLANYVTSIDDIEKKTGVDILSRLIDEIEKPIEEHVQAKLL